MSDVQITEFEYVDGVARVTARWPDPRTDEDAKWRITADACDEMLTSDEHAAVDALSDAWNAVVKVVNAGGNPDTFDTHELVGHVHALQNAVLANAAARAYPGTYRLLGGTLRKPDRCRWSEARQRWETVIGPGVSAEACGHRYDSPLHRAIVDAIR